jgi:hypothetical protein
MGLVTTTSNKIVPKTLYTDCGHVIEDRLSTLLKWVVGYKLSLNGLVGTTLKPCQTSHEIFTMTTSTQVNVVTGKGKANYIP